MSVRVGQASHAPSFPAAAKRLLADAQVRSNVRRATETIRAKRAKVVAEMADWQELRSAAHAIKEHTLRYLDFYLERFEANCARAGGRVHWARDADEANEIVIDLIRGTGQSEVIKVKTMTSDETQLNVALEAAGITPHETDLADLIVQLGEDKPSHIVVPALHRNRAEIRRIFMRKMGLTELSDRAGGPGGGGARLSAREVFESEGRIQRGELCHRRDGLDLRGGVGRQRTNVRDACPKS